MATDSNYISNEAYAKLCRMVERIDQKLAHISGPGVKHWPNAITINPPQPAQRQTGELPDGFWARISDSTQDGTNKRWKYDFVEVEKTVAAYGGWTDVTDGITGTSAGGDPAFNDIEDQNAATGTWGNGVTSTNLTGTFDIQPVPDGTRVWMRWVYLSDGTREPWFTYANGIDGTCS